MIVIPHEAIMPPHQPQARGTQNTTQTQAERKAEEDIRAATDLHARCDAIRATRKASMGGRFVSAKLEVDGQMRTLTSAYAPATPKAGEPISKRPAFFESMKKLLRKDTILGIDANCVPDVSLDTRRDATTAYDNAGAKELAEAIDEKGLVDITRQSLGSEFFWTSHHIVTGGQQCWTRIDQIYVPADGDTQWEPVKKLSFFPKRTEAVEMDHIEIEARSVKVKNTRGTDMESVNEKIFDNPGFVQQLHTLITDALNEKEEELDEQKGWRDFWERLKIELKNKCLEATARLRYQESTEIKRMKAQINSLSKVIDSGKATADQISRRVDIAQKVKDKRKQEYTLHQTLEREAYNMGKAHDNCTTEFYRPWKPNHAAQHIAALLKANWTDPSNPTFEGGEAKGDKEVLEELTKYYEALFGMKPTDPAAVLECLQTLEDPTSRRVLPPTAEKCDAPIGLGEVKSVMNSLPTGKSPGPDRLPNKMYRVLSVVLSKIMVKVLNESQAEGALPETMKQGIISVLYKKKERNDPRNYRPITLLNGDYKIFTRILTRRMNEAVLQFVSPQQNGFVPGGFLPENIMLLKLIQAYVEAEDEDAYFVYLDMEKAFDRCSWTYLHEALHKIGFNGSQEGTSDTKGFVDYIKLFYNHEQPPTRQLCMNGHLGPRFPLHSGVAQGCPISPLLFLVITEALTRLIVNDPDTGGVTINGVRHVISLYADDSTLIGKGAADWKVKEKKKKTWCGATSMHENDTKREGQLMGKLNRQRWRAPKGIIKDEAWVKDGDTIRALGVPMGNKVDECEWWRKRYRTVKQRIAAWRSISHMSITGRNLLLQAILYGSLRFWLFSMTMPDEISKLVEQDAYHLIWASNPELFTNEEGTAKKSVAYIHRPASYIDQKKGGGGLMHWRSHVRAFYVQWIRRYLHPSDPPWKSVADVWLAEPYPMGKGMILASMTGNMYENIHAPYLRACVKEFEALNLKQDMSIIGPNIAAESVFFSNRFHLNNVSDDAAAAWSKYVELVRMKDLIDQDTGHVHKDEEIEEYTFTRAPPGIRGTPSVWEWSEEMMKTWPAIRDEIPQQLIQAAGEIPEIADGSYVALMPDTGPHYYAKAEKDELTANVRYHKQWIDTFGTPHDTGVYVSDYRLMKDEMTTAALWVDEKDEDAHYNFRGTANADGDEEPETRTYIIGPTTLAFPINKGWAPAVQNPDPQYAIEELADLTIKRVTKLITVTEQIKNNRPNCEEAWALRIGFTPPFDEIWPSLGTPLSDATEEKEWRKMLQRAIYVRNRDSERIKAGTTQCRLGCRCEESMWHLVKCRYTMGFWKLVMNFLETVLGQPRVNRIDIAVIFNVCHVPNGTLYSIEARAFVRHAFGCFYKDFSKVDTLGHAFTPVYTFRRTMENFRNAVWAYGESIKLFKTHRRYTPLKQHVPKETLEQFPDLITIDPNTYSHSLTDKFKQACTDATDAATAYARRNDRQG